MEFYKVLLQIMEDRSLSIPDIARSCGLSDSTIRSVINRKQRSVALDVAFKISSGLQVDLEYLNTGVHADGGEVLTADAGDNVWFTRLNNLKKQCGMTLEQISQASGVPRGTLNKLFAGQTKDPQLGTVTAVLHCMGYTLDDLDPRPQYENGASIVLSDEELEVVKNYRLLDARGRDTVRRCIANQLQYSGKGE